MLHRASSFIFFFFFRKRGGCILMHNICLARGLSWKSINMGVMTYLKFITNNRSDKIFIRNISFISSYSSQFPGYKKSESNLSKRLV
jgi:hypothetical protein